MNKTLLARLEKLEQAKTPPKPIQILFAENQAESDRLSAELAARGEDERNYIIVSWIGSDERAAA